MAQAFSCLVSLPGCAYLELLAWVDAWQDFRSLCRQAGFVPPAGKPKRKVPREDAAVAAAEPGVLLGRDPDQPSEQWQPIALRGPGSEHTQS